MKAGVEVYKQGKHNGRDMRVLLCLLPPSCSEQQTQRCDYCWFMEHPLTLFPTTTLLEWQYKCSRMLKIVWSKYTSSLLWPWLSLLGRPNKVEMKVYNTNRMYVLGLFLDLHPGFCHMQTRKATRRGEGLQGTSSLLYKRIKIGGVGSHTIRNFYATIDSIGGILSMIPQAGSCSYTLAT